MSEQLDDFGPAVVRGAPARGPDNFVAPVRREQSHWTQASPPMLHQAAPPAVADVEPVWRPTEAAREVGTPVHRALATLLRAAPLILLLLPATVGLLWLLDAGWAWLLPLWGLISIAGYLVLVLIDLTFNAPSATERHRISTAASLKRMELRQAHELRRAIVEAYLKHMERTEQ